MNSRTVYFTMVRHPTRGLQRVGNAYPSRKAAAEWLPFVRGAWRGCAVSIAQCTLRFKNDALTEASKRVLDRKFNLDAPDVAEAAGKGT